MGLLEKYEQMVKEANTSKVNTAGELTDEQILQKYAEAATDLLIKEKGKDKFTDDDVVKVANALIEQDEKLIKEAEELQNQEDLQKIAEAHEIGTIMAEAFLARIKQDKDV